MSNIIKNIFLFNVIKVNMLLNERLFLNRDVIKRVSSKSTRLNHYVCKFP